MNVRMENIPLWSLLNACAMLIIWDMMVISLLVQVKNVYCWIPIIWKLWIFCLRRCIICWTCLLFSVNTNPSTHGNGTSDALATTPVMDEGGLVAYEYMMRMWGSWMRSRPWESVGHDRHCTSPWGRAECLHRNCATTHWWYAYHRGWAECSCRSFGAEWVGQKCRMKWLRH